MSADRRHRNKNWCVADDNGDLYANTRDGVMLALLMDIRDEMLALNRMIRTSGFCSVREGIKRIDRRLQSHMPLKRGRKNVRRK